MKYQFSEWEQKVKAAFENRTETHLVDFKEDLSEDTERFKEHLNAFGNSSEGGIFVFGITNDFTLTSKQLDFDFITKKLSDLSKDTQTPSLRIKAHFFNLKGQAVLGIEIRKGEKQPVFIRDRGPWSGRACFKRSGNTTVAMSEIEIREMLAHEKSFYNDSEQVEGSKFEDLNLNLLEEKIHGFKANDFTSLANLRILLDNKILTGQISDWRISLAGWLLFAKNPQSIRELNKVSIEFQHFRGFTRAEPIKKLNISGTLDQQIFIALETLQQNIWSVPKIQGMKREDVPAYDNLTLREIIINSVVHRDYRQLHQPVKIALFNDRLEVENPGGLLPGLTPLNLIHKRAWRNPTLASLMEKFGLGEMDGQGIDRIYAGAHRIRVPAPIFIDEHRSFKVILSAPKSFEDYSPEEKRLTVLTLLMLEHEIDNQSIRNAFAIDITKASTLIKALIEEGMIEAISKSKKFAKYRLTANYNQKIFG